VPATTAVASWPVLGQRLGMTAVAGLVVAAAGVTLIQRRPATEPSVGATRRGPALLVE
jgi:drug/metabolite transporter (DMT)-like permease